MATFTHYEILDVAPDADAVAIKAAYRVASKAVHPDASGASAALFAQVTEAYRVLSDPSARRRYDEALNPSSPPPPPPRPSSSPVRYTGPPPSAAPRKEPQPSPAASPAEQSRRWKAGVGFVGSGLVIAAVSAFVTHGWARAGYGVAVVVLAVALAVVLSPAFRPTGSDRLAVATRGRWVQVLAWAVALVGSAVAWAPVLLGVVLAVMAAVIVVLVLGFIRAVAGD
ncbi:MAG: J domain-containing protein [Microthrixaceae bacterium]